MIDELLKELEKIGDKYNPDIQYFSYVSSYDSAYNMGYKIGSNEERRLIRNMVRKYKRKIRKEGLASITLEKKDE